MRTCLITTVFLFFSAYAFSQTPSGQAASGAIVTAASFLLIQSNSQAAGAGEIGAVAASDYKAIGLSQNPALLAGSGQPVGAMANYSPWLRALGIPGIHLYDWGVYAGINEHLVLGYYGKRFEIGDLYIFDPLGQPNAIQSVREQQHSFRAASPLTDYLSVGAGISFISTNLDEFGDWTDNDNRIRKVAGDVGLLFHQSYQQSSRNTMNWNSGLSIQNIGSKVKYTSANGNFLPTNLQFGTMLSEKISLSENSSITLEGSYQFSKLLVPSEGSASELSAIAGMFASFNDSPEGFQGELKEVIHQFGVESRYKHQNSFFTAVRAGLFLESMDRGRRRYATIGAGIGYWGFRLDAAYLVPFTQNHPLQRTVRLALSYSMDLEPGP